MLGCGLSPLIAAALLGLTQDQANWPISLYLIGGALVSAVCLVVIGEMISDRAPSPAPAEP